MDDRAIRTWWRVWPLAALVAVVALIVFGARERPELAEEGGAAPAAEPAPAIPAPVPPPAGDDVAREPHPNDARTASPIATVTAAAPPEPVRDSEPSEPAVSTGASGSIGPSESEPTLEQRARLLFGALRGRFEHTVDEVAERVDRDALVAGGAQVGRLVPFVGPCLRYGEARALYRSEDPADRERARRLVVLALADLLIDTSSAGLGKTAAGSSGLVEALEGAVDLAELSAKLLLVRDALGQGSSAEALAGRALTDVDGLAVVVEELLQLEVEAEIDALRGGLTERGRALVEAVEERLRRRE